MLMAGGRAYGHATNRMTNVSTSVSLWKGPIQGPPENMHRATIPYNTLCT
jgi:hypothetical protein